jgi:hypothetical protein
VRTLLTGAAQPVTNTTERVREHFKDRAEWNPESRPEKKFSRRPQKTRPEPKLLDAGEGEQSGRP